MLLAQSSYMTKLAMDRENTIFRGVPKSRWLRMCTYNPLIGWDEHKWELFWLLVYYFPISYSFSALCVKMDLGLLSNFPFLASREYKRDIVE